MLIRSKRNPSVILMTGYERIVYGDHGPYFEFTNEQVVWNSYPTVIKRSSSAYYDAAFTKGKIRRKGIPHGMDKHNVKIYIRKKR